MAGGGFVQIKGSRDGIGKIVGISGTRAEIDYFVSPAATEMQRRNAPLDQVEAVELSPQTRVYWFDDKHDGWRAGRVDGGLVSAEALRASENHYHVRFPNGVEARIPQSRLFVRWSHPIDEPTDYLAARITDTPFFFDGRVRVLRSLANERAAFGGLSALASSAIELLEHQVTTVRHISADPIQRYLLADEVGLGKTIEAGVLIRQHVIDTDHRAHVVVVAPHHLVAQWSRELAEKFFVTEQTGVRVVSEANLGTLDSDITMLVIDEAHRTALRAFSDHAAERRIFEQLRVLATRVPRLLLLSGTPVLHREDGFLAMLHLLDPEGYPLEGRDAFRRRVQGRQTVAEAAADLADDATGFFIEDALARLEDLFADDSRLRELCGAMRRVANADVDDEKRLNTLRSLRSHISETYRLHRRLLRTRRDDARVKDLLPRRMGTLVLQHECQARRESVDLLETWRAMYTGQQPSAEYERLFGMLVESALSHPSVLLRHIDARLTALTVEPSSARELRLDVLRLPPAFDAEASLLAERRPLIAAALQEDRRCDRLAEWIRTTRDVRKVIVFVDDRQVADSLAKRLSLDVVGVLRHGPGLSSEEAFSTSDKARVLVCDASAEEGLNLQRIGASVVHYDLPLDLSRIEQRIGRVDRLEAQKNVQSIVLTSNAPYEQEWIACLRDAVRVFERSVSPLQYLLVDETTAIRASLVNEGPAAISAAHARMCDETRGLDAELKRIRAQEALDASELDPEIERAFFELVQESDAFSEENGEIEFNSWVVDRLLFSRREEEDGGFRYVHSAPTSRRPTLVPLFEAVTRFGVSVDRDPRSRASRSELPFRRATFQRATAEEERIDLLRIGHPFVDGTEVLLRADDRGAAFAMWRHLPNWSDEPRLFFRFDFVVEADLWPAMQVVESLVGTAAALKRRAERAFPMEHSTVWLDADMVEVGLKVQAQLELPYANKKSRPDGGLDVNLRLERWAHADRLVPTGDWPGMCGRARRAAETVVRTSPAFKDRCERHAMQTLDAAARAGDTLRSRVERLDGSARLAEERATLFEHNLAQAIAKGIESPSIRADSVGCVFLSAVPLGGE